MAQRFVQLSDPHLSTLEGVGLSRLLSKRLLSYISWRRKRRYEHRPEVLDALLEDLQGQSLSQRLVSGDLTHTGLPEEFHQARAWLERLGEPGEVAVIPGNHDALVATPWEDSFALWQDYMCSDDGTGTGDGLWPSLRIRDEVAFIGLSSACPTPPLMASGVVDAGQLEALSGLLAETRGKFRVVSVHHSPVPGVEKWRKSLRNAAQLAAVIESQGAELVLHGHGHRARRDLLGGRDGDVPVFSVPSASALGLHGADVAAYNCYTVQREASGWDLSVESRHYDVASGIFREGPTEQIAIPRSG